MAEINQERYKSTIREPESRLESNQEEEIITDKRLKSRKEFMSIPSKDAKERLSMLPTTMASDRRQRIFQENRSKKMESKNKSDKQTENNPRNLTTMIKEITEALNQFKEVTNKEVENIKRIVEINHKSHIIEQKETKKDKEIIESRIQNIIINHKELCQK